MEALLNSHFMEGDQRYHKMLFAQEFGIGACSGPKPRVTGYPWSHHQSVWTPWSLVLSFCLRHSNCNGLLAQGELLPEQRLREIKFLPEVTQQS